MVTGKEMADRPYPPPSNVVSVLQHLRTHNLPDRFDGEYLRDIGIPEGTIGRTLFALRFLKLIDEGGLLTEPLKSIHTSTDEEYKAVLSGLIREAYKDTFNVVDPSQETQDKILNVFRKYTPASQRDRMVTFFLGMCREAGITTLDVPKARSMGMPKIERKSLSGMVTRASASISSSRGRVSAQKAMITGIDPALEGLIRTLPKPGEPLSEARRKQWLHMAEATLRFVYPEAQAEETIKESMPDTEGKGN